MLPQAEVPDQGRAGQQGQHRAHPYGRVHQGNRSGGHGQPAAGPESGAPHPLEALRTCWGHAAFSSPVSSHHANDINAPRLQSLQFCLADRGVERGPLLGSPTAFPEQQPVLVDRGGGGTPVHHGAAVLGHHVHFSQARWGRRLGGAGEPRAQAGLGPGPLQLPAGHLQVAATVVVTEDSRQRRPWSLIFLLFLKGLRDQGPRCGN